MSSRKDAPFLHQAADVAKQNGWTNTYITPDGCEDCHLEYAILDPAFWKAWGRVTGWGVDWFNYARQYYRLLTDEDKLEGKTTEQYLQHLLEVHNNFPSQGAE